MMLVSWTELALILAASAAPFAGFVWWFGAQPRDYGDT